MEQISKFSKKIISDLMEQISNFLKKIISDLIVHILVSSKTAS